MRRGAGWNCRWLSAVVAATLLTSSLSMLVATPVQAADVILGSAIGVGRQGDTRVLEIGGDGVSEGSPVTTAAYRLGVAGTEIDRQRWAWERLPAAHGRPDFTYRIRNTAADKCLDRSGNANVNGAKVALRACDGGANQMWSTPLSTHDEGFSLFTLADGRCLDIPRGSTALGVQVVTWDCGGSRNQRWRLKSGSFDCGKRSRDWTITALCVRSEEAVQGLDASWRNNPVGISWLDPKTWALSNAVQNYVTFTKPTLYSGLEYGWRAERGAQPDSGVDYNLYWSEWNEQRLDYHVVPATSAPGSTTASGLDHSYMAFPAASGDQWNLLYDFNPVTTTRLQKPGEVREVNTGLAIRYLRATTIPTAFENRVQLATGSSGMRRPYVREVAVGEPKTCEAPPHYNDFGYGMHSPGGEDKTNRSPWCFTAQVGTLGDTTGNATEINYLSVGKPGTAGLAGPVTLPATAGYQSGVLNGVDQRALVACMDTDASMCLTTVPGLAECVKARLVCNATRSSIDMAARDRSAMTVMTDEEARIAAEGMISPEYSTSDVAASLRATSVGAAVVDAAFGTRLAASAGAVKVVNGSGLLGGLVASVDPYKGFTIVFDASNHQLLYACLGSGCPALR